MATYCANNSKAHFTALGLKFSSNKNSFYAKPFTEWGPKKEEFQVIFALRKCESTLKCCLCLKSNLNTFYDAFEKKRIFPCKNWKGKKLRTSNCETFFHDFIFCENRICLFTSGK